MWRYWAEARLICWAAAKNRVPIHLMTTTQPATKNLMAATFNLMARPAPRRTIGCGIPASQKQTAAAMISLICRLSILMLRLPLPAKHLIWMTLNPSSLMTALMNGRYRLKKNRMPMPIRCWWQKMPHRLTRMIGKWMTLFQWNRTLQSLRIRSAAVMRLPPMISLSMTRRLGSLKPL